MHALEERPVIVQHAEHKPAPATGTDARTPGRRTAARHRTAVHGQTEVRNSAVCETAGSDFAG